MGRLPCGGMPPPLCPRTAFFEVDMALPLGFRLAAAAADFRNKGKTRDDLALVISERPAVAAGVFTTNLFRAAPVLVAQ